MDWLDKIQTQAETAFSNFASSAISSGLEQVGFIQVGNKAPQQNLTSAQVASGVRGTPRQSVIRERPTAETSQLKNGFGFGLAEMGMGAMTPILIVGGLIAGAFLLRK